MAWLKYKKSDGTWAKLKAIKNTESFNTKIVTELPTADISESTIYLIASENAESPDSYDEYIYTNGAWEKLGSRTTVTSTIESGDVTASDAEIGNIF